MPKLGTPFKVPTFLGALKISLHNDNQKKGGGLVRIWQNEIKHTYRYLDFIRHSYGTKFYSHILIHYINFSYSGALIRDMVEVDEEVGGRSRRDGRGG